MKRQDTNSLTMTKLFFKDMTAEIYTLMMISNKQTMTYFVNNGEHGTFVKRETKSQFTT